MTEIAIAVEGGREGAGGAFTLIAGIVLLAIGLPLAVNYRGFADRWVARNTPAADTSRFLALVENIFPASVFIKLFSAFFVTGGALSVLIGAVRIIKGDL